jgi:hypothetical protein
VLARTTLLRWTAEGDLDDRLHLSGDPRDIGQGLALIGGVEFSLARATERIHLFEYSQRGLPLRRLQPLPVLGHRVELGDTSRQGLIRCSDSAEHVKGRRMQIRNLIGGSKRPDVF